MSTDLFIFLQYSATTVQAFCEYCIKLPHIAQWAIIGATGRTVRCSPHCVAVIRTNDGAEPAALEAFRQQDPHDPHLKPGAQAAREEA